MNKKIVSILLAGTLAVSASVASVSAAMINDPNADGALGGAGKLGEYTPKSTYKTQHMMFAMPGPWQNDTTKNDAAIKGAAGIYWWGGYDTPDSVASDGHGWPGYKAAKVDEKDVPNLYAIDIPAYGNSESGNTGAIIWNNYVDGGTEILPEKNPYFDAANQTIDFPSQYYSKIDQSEKYEPLLRYTYKRQFEIIGVKGASDLDIKSDSFWTDLNKLAAVENGEDWDSLDSEEQENQAGIFLDDNNDKLDFSEYGSYASNFFNEDCVNEIYPFEGKPEPNWDCLAFNFDNMVFVVDFSPEKMVPSPLSGKIAFAGDVYFYYGNGEYGTWPTKELNEKMGGTSGNFTGDYWKKSADDIEMPTVAPATGGDKTATTVPAAATDASSSTSDTADGSNSANNANGAIATGQVSLAVIAFVVLAAGVGAVIFTRKRESK